MINFFGKDWFEINWASVQKNLSVSCFPVAEFWKGSWLSTKLRRHQSRIRNDDDAGGWLKWWLAEAARCKRESCCLVQLYLLWTQVKRQRLHIYTVALYYYTLVPTMYMVQAWYFNSLHSTVLATSHHTIRPLNIKLINSNFLLSGFNFYQAL